MKINYNKNINRDKLGFIFAIIFLIILISFWIKKGEDLNEFGTCTAGVVDHLGGVSTGHRAYFHYEVNGTMFKSYSLISKESKHLVIPEKKFVVKYQKDKPSNSAIFLNAPLPHSTELGHSIEKECCDTLTEVLKKI